MSRTLKRVPLSFNAPLKQVWKGYVNPYYKRSSECKACDGTGSSPEWKYLHDQWYGCVPFEPSMTGSTPLTTRTPSVRAFAERQCTRDFQYYGSEREEAIEYEANRLIAMWNKQWHHHLDKDDVAALIKADRLWDFTRVPRTEEDKLKPRFPNGWLVDDNGYIPTPEEVNEQYRSGFGHDSLNSWACVEAKAKRLGYKKSTCDFCKGDGRSWESPYYKGRCNSWKETQPPRGKGFQLWENCSEGSPVSPVFKTLEELAVWCVTGATTFGSSRATLSQWLDMLDENHVYHQEGNMVFL